jgi:hypothetical protein
MKLYGNDWKGEIDTLKSREVIPAKRVDDFALGDLCKIYKRIVLEKKMIDIAPLSNEEFGVLMDAAPASRNDFAHGKLDLKGWDNLFSFCSGFIPIYWRLFRAIENLTR